MTYLDYDTYCNEVKRTLNGHWTAPGIDYKDRWPYHVEAIGLLKMLNITRPDEVLEIGHLGATLIAGSDSLDYPNREFHIPGYEFTPTIWHDLRVIPWPIATGRYKALVALRVWHHLKPVEREAFLEAKRVAENIIMVCPEVNVRGRGVTRQQFTEWHGRPPEYFSDVNMGPLYLFKGACSESKS